MADDELRVRASMDNELSRPLRDVKDDVRDVRQEMDRMDRTTVSTGRSMGGLRSGVGKLASVVRTGLVTALRLGVTALAALGAAAVVGLGKVISLATDAGETLSKFNTVFGRNRREMEKWVQAQHRSFGIATKDLRDAASTFGVFGQAAGIAEKDLPKFTKGLTAAGLDLASFYNVSPEEAFLSLRSGLAGEAEPLRKFGIFLSDAAMKAKAAQMGLTGELTESQKVMVRQELILGGLGKAQGDLERTSGSLSNKWKALKGRVTELATSLGNVFLPVATKVVSALGDRLIPVIDKLQKKGPAMAKELDKRLSGLWDTAQRAKAAIGADGLAGGLNALKTQFPGLAPLIDKVVEVTEDLWRIWDVGLRPAFETAADVIPDLLQPLSLLDNLIGLIADHAEVLSPLITALVVGWASYKAITLGVMAVEKAAMLARVGLAVATGELSVAEGLATISTGALNAVMALNPIVLVVAAVAALAAGLVFAYKKSEVFRGVVDSLWQGLQTLWDWVIIGVTWVGRLFKKFTPLGILIGNFPTILRLAKTAWEGFRDAVGGVIDWIMDKIGPLVDAVGVVVGGIKRVAGLVTGGSIADKLQARIDAMGGDTATSKASGGGIGNTLGIHGRLESMTPGTRTITSAVRSWGPSGDHQAGRALDLTGSGLNTYARKLRGMGGFAEFHGTGRARHLHAAYPAGDTATSKASALSPVSADHGGATVMFDALVKVNGDVNGADIAELEAVAVRAYRTIKRDEGERS